MRREILGLQSSSLSREEFYGYSRAILRCEKHPKRMADPAQNPIVSSALGPYVAGSGLSFSRKYTPSWAR